MTDIENAVEAQKDITDFWRVHYEGDHALAVTPERLRALLELEASQPKEWTAATIKDAPEGFYTFHIDKLKRDPSIQLFTKKGVDELLSWYSKGLAPRCFAFGPIPQPHPKKEGQWWASKPLRKEVKDENSSNR